MAEKCGCVYQITVLYCDTHEPARAEAMETALDEIAWPLKDEQGCGGITVLPKTVADLQAIAKAALPKHVD